MVGLTVVCSMSYVAAGRLTFVPPLRQQQYRRMHAITATTTTTAPTISPMTTYGMEPIAPPTPAAVAGAPPGPASNDAWGAGAGHAPVKAQFVNEETYARAAPLPGE